MRTDKSLVSHSASLILILAGLLALFCPASFSEEEFGSESITNDIEELKEEIYSINLINSLVLSPSQIDVILAQARLARPFFETRASMLKEVHRRQVAVFREFKAEDELNQGLSDELINRTARAEQLEKEINDRVFVRVNKFSEKVYAILTASQQRLVEEYKPFLFPQEKIERDLHIRSDHRFRALEELLLEVNKMSTGQYRVKKSKMIDKIFNQIPRPKRPVSSNKGAKRADRKKEMAFDEDAEAIKARIAAVFDRVRTMKRTDLELEASRIIENELLVSGKEKLLRNLARIARSKHESLNNVSRFLLNPGVIVYLGEARRKAKGGAVVEVR